VVGLEWLDPPFAVGHWVPDQIRRAGGWDLLGHDGEPAREIDWAAVADVDPDLLLLMPCGYHLGETVADWGAAPRPDWLDDLTAIRRGHLIALDGSSYFSRPGPRVVDGIEMLAEIFDPEAFRDLSPRPAGRRSSERVGTDPGAGQLRRRGRGAALDVRLPVVRAVLDDALAGRPRGVRPALPGLPRQGRRQRVPAISAGALEAGRKSPRAAVPRRAPGRHRRCSAPAEPDPIEREMVAYYEARAANTTTGISGAVATPTARSTTRPGTRSSTPPGAGSTRCRCAVASSSSPRARAGGRRSSPEGRAVAVRRRRGAAARARDRLLAHGLRAHLHVRDAWAEPDGEPAGALFAGFWLSHIRRERTGAFLDLAGRWLAPGGRVASHRLAAGPAVRRGRPRPIAEDGRSVRRLADGREFSVIKVYRSAEETRGGRCATAGFVDVRGHDHGPVLPAATGRKP
jgi:hypothetical protein